MVRARVGAATVLLPGDAEVELQQALLRRYGPAGLRADVLKVPHHGSGYQDAAFLDAVGPAVALIPVGAGNDYGHPSPALVDGLRQGGARVLRTDTDGDVAAIRHGTGLAVVTHTPPPGRRRGGRRARIRWSVARYVAGGRSTAGSRRGWGASGCHGRAGAESEEAPRERLEVGAVSTDNGELLAAANRGDETAWGVLVDRYNGLLWSIARSFQLSSPDAADAIQNAWLRLVENLDRVHEPERLGSWLATTVRRECLQLIRRRSRDRISLTPDLLADVADSGAPVDAGLLLDERDAALWRAVDALSIQCRQLLRVLMASFPPSYAEVAAALGMAVGSIGPARQRCLERLRQVAMSDGVLSGHTSGTEDGS